MAVRTNILLKLSNFVDSLITFAKLQNIATNKILGRTTTGSGVIEELDINNYKNYELNTSTTDGTYNKSDLNGKFLIRLAASQVFRVGTGFSAGDVLIFVTEDRNISTASQITFDGFYGYAFSAGMVHCVYTGTYWIVNGAGTSWKSNDAGGSDGKISLGHNNNNRSNFSTSVGASNFIISGLNRAVALGVSATVTGDYSTVTGISTSDNGFPHSVMLGYLGTGRRYGSMRRSMRISGTNPDYNKEWVSWAGTTTNNTIAELFLRGVSSNRCVLQAKNVISFKGQAVAFLSNYTGSARWDIEGLIKRNNGNNTTLVGVTTTLTHSDGTGNTLVLTIDADDTNEALRVQVTGNASETWTWLVELELLDLRIA